MNLTTEMILRAVRDGEQVRSRFNVGIKEQQDLERELLKGKSFCTKQRGREAETNPPLAVNLDTLEKAVDRQFYNPDIMMAVSCVSDSLVLGHGGLDASDRIREHLTHLHRIGSASANGTAFVADLSSGVGTNVADDLFVVKAPQSSATPEEMAHEVAVGFATNALRTYVPNYAYIFGYFSCGGPILRGADVVSWCRGSGPGSVGYALYENIQGAKSFKSYVQTETPQRIWRAYLQILMALRCGQTRAKFTHYDLHCENILIRPAKSAEFNIPMDDFYVKADGICTMIDFGMSHVEWKDGRGRYNLGYVGKHAPLSMYGIYRDRMHPMHDAYKLLCFMLWDLLREQRDKSYMPINGTYEQLAPLLRFFNKTENPLAIVVLQRAVWFSTPHPGTDKDYNREVAKFNLVDFIDYCRQYGTDRGWEDPIVVPGAARGSVLRCSTTCYDPSSLVRPSGPPFDNMLGFYDAYIPYLTRVNDAVESRRPPMITQANLELNSFVRVAEKYLPNALRKERVRISNLGQKLVRKRFLALQPSVSWLKANRRKVEENAAEMAAWLDAYHRLTVIKDVLEYVASLNGMMSEVAQDANMAMRILREAERYSPRTVIENGIRIISPQTYGGVPSQPLIEFMETKDGQWYLSLYQNLIMMAS